MKTKIRDDWNADHNNKKKYSFDTLMNSGNITDIGIAKEYIHQFNMDTVMIDKFLVTNNLPPITTQIWIDGATICNLAKFMADSASGFDGLRFYLAKYPVFANYPDPIRGSHPNDRGAYDKRVTSVVVTTKKVGSGHADYYINAQGQIQGLVNYHDICPPTCPPTPPAGSNGLETYP
jgi:hypothetical protein